MIFSSEQNRKTYRMDSTFEMTQKHCLPLHMESGVPTIADIQPRFWTQRRTSHCFQLGHHFVCLFPNAMKTFYQVHDIFSSTSAPPPSHPKKNYLGYFEFRGMNSTEIYPILVHAFVYQRNPDLHLTFITIPLCIEIGASASWDILSCVCIWKQTLCCRYLQYHNILGQFPTTTNI